MQLTRRDAIAALSAAGLGGAGVTVYRSDVRRNRFADDELLDTVRALAAVLYPSAVEVTDSFLETYVLGRIEDDESYKTEMVAAVTWLDERARSTFDEPFAALSPERGDTLLRELGTDQVHPDPNGDDRQRFRYYLVNELLFALFTTPKGGELVGTENPPGYPGGRQSYQRGPQS